MNVENSKHKDIQEEYYQLKIVEKLDKEWVKKHLETKYYVKRPWLNRVLKKSETKKPLN